MEHDLEKLMVSQVVRLFNQEVYYHVHKSPPLDSAEWVYCISDTPFFCSILIFWVVWGFRATAGFMRPTQLRVTATLVPQFFGNVFVTYPCADVY
jgi:hypothetical protein